MIIAIDFDGTIVEYAYPNIGAPVPNAIKWMKEFQKAGAKLILWTVRSDNEDEQPLSEAIEYCESKGIYFWGINSNPGQSWSSSPKQFAHIYIDDAAFGCPLRKPRKMGGRPSVDWDVVGPKVMAMIKAAGPD